MHVKLFQKDSKKLINITENNILKQISLLINEYCCSILRFNYAISVLPKTIKHTNICDTDFRYVFNLIFVLLNYYLTKLRLPEEFLNVGVEKFVISLQINII